MVTLLLFAVLGIGAWLLSALCLWYGAVLVQATKARFTRAVLATLAITGTGTVLIPLVWLSDAKHLAEWSCVYLVVRIAVGVAIVAMLMGTTFVRAFGAFLISEAPGVFALALVPLIVRPYLLESFAISSNAMAPALVGWHEEGTCPRCHAKLIVPAAAPNAPRVEEEEVLGICTSCLQTSTISRPHGSITEPDCIVVNKLQRPHRWDVVVCREPGTSSVRIAKRLVGLPGEIVYVKDSAVWINDVRIQPPTELDGMRYSTEVAAGVAINVGMQENPLRLRDNEYCVLGDFSLRSSDSRFWGPVPGENIEGVVTLRYWPMARWKIFR